MSWNGGRGGGGGWGGGGNQYGNFQGRGGFNNQMGMGGMGMGGMGMGMGMGMGGPRMGGMGFNNGVAPGGGLRPAAPMAPIAAIKKSLTLQVPVPNITEHLYWYFIFSVAIRNLVSGTVLFFELFLINLFSIGDTTVLFSDD